MSERDGLVARFAERAAEVSAGFVVADGADAARAALVAVVRAAGAAPSVLVDPAVEALLPGATAAVGGTALAPDTPRAALAAVDVVVTGCAALVAELGSVLLVAGATPVRAASVLAQRHVVVATDDDLVPDLAAAFARVPPGREASGQVLITGPSRTADIEKTLVLGAHGPLALDVILARHSQPGSDTLVVARTPPSPDSASLAPPGPAWPTTNVTSSQTGTELPSA